MKRKKKSHIFQNRKAFFTNPIVDFFVYLVFIMVVIFFVTIFRVSSGTIERTIKSDFQDLDLEKSMLAYLRAPIIIDSKNMQISDLFYLFYILDDEEFEDRYEGIIEEDLKKIFSSQGKLFCWSLVFYDTPEINKLPEIISNCNFEGQEVTNAKKARGIDFFIPIINDVPLRIQLKYAHFTHNADVLDQKFI